MAILLHGWQENMQGCRFVTYTKYDFEEWEGNFTFRDAYLRRNSRAYCPLILLYPGSRAWRRLNMPEQKQEGVILRHDGIGGQDKHSEYHLMQSMDFWTPADPYTILTGGEGKQDPDEDLEACDRTYGLYLFLGSA